MKLFNFLKQKASSPNDQQGFTENSQKNSISKKIEQEKNDTGVDREELILKIKEEAKKSLKKIKVSKYIGPSGFNSVNELESSVFITLLIDLTGGLLKEKEIVNLAISHYGLSEGIARKFLKEAKQSRGL